MRAASTLLLASLTMLTVGAGCAAEGTTSETEPAPAASASTGEDTTTPPPPADPLQPEDGAGTSPGATTPAVQGKVQALAYGTSARGKALQVYEVSPAKPNGKKALMVFGVHGFEDAWDHDGTALFAIAHAVIAHFAAHPDDLHGWTLQIVPTANPDGMLDGKNNYREGQSGAYGRCTASGKDINRNFSTASMPEHDALEALVDRVKPSVVLDFHGWYNCYYGSRPVGGYFAKAFNARYASKPSRYCYVRSAGTMDCGNTLGGTFHENSGISDDLFAEWATSQRGIPAALIEYPAPDLDLDGRYDTTRGSDGRQELRQGTLDVFAGRTVAAMTDLTAHFTTSSAK